MRKPISPPIKDIASDTSKHHIKTSLTENEHSEFFLQGKWSKNIQYSYNAYSKLLLANVISLFCLLGSQDDKNLNDLRLEDSKAKTKIRPNVNDTSSNLIVESFQSNPETQTKNR